MQGGARFTGQLKLSADDAGDPHDAVHIGSYGSGRATIVGVRESGLVVYDTGGVDISNLDIVGQDAMQANTCGIVLFSTRTGESRLDHVAIADVDISGFGNGVYVYPEHDTGFSNVAVSDSVLHGNLVAGLGSFGPPFNPAAPAYANSDFRIEHVVAYDNLGDPADKTRNTGSGIALGSVENALISWSTAYDNGGRGRAKHEGPEGIWAYDATDVRIEHDLSYDNNSSSAADGGGFEFDQNTTDSVMQYNVAYGNHGPGFELYGPWHKPQSHNVIRFNVSSGDGLARTKVGGITIAGYTSHASIYQNTVVVGSPAVPNHAAIMFGNMVRSVTVRNNIFVAKRPEPLVLALGAVTPKAARFQGNDYYSAAGPWTVIWGPSAYPSLQSWRSATGQEQLGRKTTGHAVDPRLVGPVLGVNGADLATIAAAFVPRAGSPVLAAGLALRLLFGVQPGDVNLAGDPYSVSAPNIGAQ